MCHSLVHHVRLQCIILYSNNDLTDPAHISWQEPKHKAASLSLVIYCTIEIANQPFGRKGMEHHRDRAVARIGVQASLHTQNSNAIN